ncbi:5636_t:CDS:2, partial [Racocetra fulgida]
FIKVLKEKSNEYNCFAICNACKEARGYDYGYLNKFVNTKRLVKTHLKNCIYFKNKKGEDEAKRILDETNSEKLKNNQKKCQLEQEYKGPLDLHFQKVLAISQLCGIFAQDYKVQELDELKKLYESTSTISLLNYTNVESDYTKTDIDDEIDQKAKWPLDSLFLADLDAPFFVTF